MECAFRCRQQLKRKRALLDCAHCNETLLCCLECAQSHEVCLPCVPAVRTKRKTEEIREIVAEAFASECAFSDKDYSESELWSKLSDGVVVTPITVAMDMTGGHSVDDDYHTKHKRVGHLRKISIESSAIEVKSLEQELQKWAEDFDFNERDLMACLKYEPYSIACGRWSGLYTIYGYTVSKEECLRQEMDERGFAFSLTRYPIEKSAALSVHYDQDLKKYVARPDSEVPQDVLDAAVVQASKYDLTHSENFTLYAYWESN